MAISLKLFKPDSKLSMISKTNSSGSGKLIELQGIKQVRRVVFAGLRNNGNFRRQTVGELGDTHGIGE